MIKTEITYPNGEIIHRNSDGLSEEQLIIDNIPRSELDKYNKNKLEYINKVLIYTNNQRIENLPKLSID